MSDLINYAVGNTAGRDHLQWPTITLAQLTTLGYSRTTGISLLQALACAWRVKRWNVGGTASIGLHTVINRTSPTRVEDYTVASSFSFSDQPMPMLKDDGNLATREQHIVEVSNQSEVYGFVGLRNGGFQLHTGGVFSPPPPRLFVNETSTYTFDKSPPEFYDPPQSGTETGTFSQLLQLDFLMFGNTTNREYVGFDSNLFYPFIQASGLLFPHHAAQISFQIQSAGSNGTLTVDPVVATSFTLPVKIDGFYVGSGTGISNTVTSAGIALTMTADQFWPFANSVGDPVWDGATGAQINDPFS